MRNYVLASIGLGLLCIGLTGTAQALGLRRSAYHGGCYAGGYSSGCYSGGVAMGGCADAGYGYAGGDCGAAPACGPAVQYETVSVIQYRTEQRVDYQEVRRMVQRTVPHVEEREVVETVYDPVWREVAAERTITVPQTYQERRTRDVVRTEWTTQQQERVYKVPQTRYEDRPYTVNTTRWVDQPREFVVNVPHTTYEQRQIPYTRYETVQEMTCRPVVSTQQIMVPMCNPCTGMTCMISQCVQCVHHEMVPVCRQVAVQDMRTITVPVCTTVQERRTVVEKVATTVPETRVARVPVTDYIEKRDVYNIQVPVQRKDVEEYTVTLCRMVEQKQPYTYRVMEQVPRQVKRIVHVHSCRTVSEEVVDRVPVVTCVQVPYEVQVCRPVSCCN